MLQIDDLIDELNIKRTVPSNRFQYYENKINNFDFFNNCMIPRKSIANQAGGVNEALNNFMSSQSLEKSSSHIQT